jgi:hypothetical protein
MQEEEWPLGPASAKVLRMANCMLVELRGYVTAQAYEALHLRMGAEPAEYRRLIFGVAACLVATNESLVEAASRGTGARDRRGVEIAVPPARRAWAELHCLISSDYGLSRRTSLVEQVVQAAAH